LNFSLSSPSEFENRTINDLIQPGGARMKQPDSALNGFCKAAESFPAPVIGSLLLSKLNEEIPFVSKAVKNFSYINSFLTSPQENPLFT